MQLKGRKRGTSPLQALPCIHFVCVVLKHTVRSILETKICLHEDMGGYGKDGISIYVSIYVSI